MQPTKIFQININDHRKIIHEIDYEMWNEIIDKFHYSFFRSLTNNINFPIYSIYEESTNSFKYETS